MRIQEHIAKLSWTGADKLLAILFGFVQIIQFRALPTEEFGVFSLINGFALYVFAISDSIALQGMIRFGIGANKASASAFGIRLHCGIVLGMAVLAWSASRADALFSATLCSALAHIPLLLAAGCFRMVGLRLLYRDLRMREVFLVNAAYFGAMTILTVVLMWRGYFSTFLDVVFVTCVGHIAGSLIAFLYTRADWSIRLDTSLNKRDFLRFGADQTMIGIVHNAIRQLDVYAVQFYFGASTVGLYSSAKTLFRVCTDMTDAIAGILYPIATRLHTQHRTDELRRVIAKALSFLCLGLSLITIASLVGCTSLVLDIILPTHYAGAGAYLVLLTYLAPCLPLTMLGSVLSGIGRSRDVLYASWIGAGAGIVAVILIGFFHAPQYVPLGYGAYLCVFGLLCFRAVRASVGVQWHDLWRAVPDTWNFFRKKNNTRISP
jgi:O-antigen/teichoic acid export membrane protein